KRWLYCDESPELLFTENETNNARLYGGENRTRFVKDAFNDFLIHGNSNAVNPEKRGTKAAAHYAVDVPANSERIFRLRLSDKEFLSKDAKTSKKSKISVSDGFEDFDEIFADRKYETDEFYSGIIPKDLSADAKNVQRQAFAGML